jgi:hypothetical protein
MNDDYDSQLLYAAKMIFEGSMAVATKLPGLSELKNEVLWTLQGEVLWTYTGYMIRELTRMLGTDSRDAVEDEVLPVVIQVMMERIFNWQEGSSSQQMSQHENFLYWFDEAEIGAHLTTGFAPTEEALTAMAETGQIPGDTYVMRLCRRVATLTAKDGRSELIQALARDTVETYEAMGFADMTARLAQGRQALYEGSDGGEEPEPPSP